LVSTGQHPGFAHPGIAEALCEVHFQFGEAGWKPTAFGDFFVALQPDFPELEPVAEMGVQFQLGAGGLPPGARNNARALALLQKWLADDSDYDERVWPVVKQAIEKNRMSDRAPFNG